MKKVPFVTKEQLDEIVKKYPTPFTFMMRRESERMQERYIKRFHGIKASRNILLLRRHQTQRFCRS